MELKELITGILSLVISSLIAFGVWINKSITARPTREELNELVKMELKELYILQAVQKEDIIELKEALKEFSSKLDKVVDKLSELIVETRK